MAGPFHAWVVTVENDSTSAGVSDTFQGVVMCGAFEWSGGG